jgi:hypothetical protein
MSHMEPSEKEEIRARTDIVALIGQYTTLRQTGRNFKGLCPFHQEKTPSFTVDPEMGRWHCFGACSEGGDVFKFLMKAESLTFIEAAERLAERAGVTLLRGGRNGADTEAARQAQNERDRLFAANAHALQFFREAFGKHRGRARIRAKPQPGPRNAASLGHRLRAGRLWGRRLGIACHVLAAAERPFGRRGKGRAGVPVAPRRERVY